ncbi:hypothetical protein FVE85_0588 [Porphyridium purpureum]|uniref:4Fe-4S ferredoxin-type domain-containing protein n=1 Tax=Porphyridium purpureum TaxID=35688 RepID=A0A5J4YZ09_PORPP|nr:hypothetical protein FVE85_0588 [Porphyridium purpureum]|eukprot:POR4627..scf208_2
MLAFVNAGYLAVWKRPRVVDSRVGCTVRKARSFPHMREDSIVILDTRVSADKDALRCVLQRASSRGSVGLVSLKRQNWVKLICGASTEDVPLVRNLALVYTLAGVDCIDCAADEAVVRAVRQGIDTANSVLDRFELSQRQPILMVSVNDDEDPHFRKAVFDPDRCPSDCPRPCEISCPADAIGLQGVDRAKCYGCGRCIPVCPLGIIDAVHYTRPIEQLVELISRMKVDAIEIHTRPQGVAAFARFWDRAGAVAMTENDTTHTLLRELKLVAISFPDMPDLTGEMRKMHLVLGHDAASHVELIWQTDGRPMSGDLGKGTSHASVRLAEKALDGVHSLGLPGFVQLAGGTNEHTHVLLQQRSKLLTAAQFGGVAFGGAARKAVRPMLTTQNGESVEDLEQDWRRLADAITAALQFILPN